MSEKLDLSAIPPSKVPARREAPKGNYVFTVQSYERYISDKTGNEGYKVAFRIAEPLDGQDIKGAKRFVNITYWFNEDGGRDLWNAIRSANPEANRDENFVNLLEEVTGSNLIAELDYDKKNFPRLRKYRAAA